MLCPTICASTNLWSTPRRLLRIVRSQRGGCSACFWPRTEQWLLDRQNAHGDWAGLFAGTLYSVVALRCLGYARDHSVVEHGLEGIERLAIRDQGASSFRVQPSISPVWDTALAVSALAEAGLSPSVRAPESQPSTLRWLDEDRRWPQPLPVRQSHCLAALAQQGSEEAPPLMHTLTWCARRDGWSAGRYFAPATGPVRLVAHCPADGRFSSTTPLRRT